jgi:ABC-2 type transport system permease protein
MAETLTAAAGMIKRDFLIYMSYRTRFVSQMLSLFFTLTLFYYVSRLVTVGSFQSPDAYYAFAVVGLVILQVVNSTLYSPPGALQAELYAGTFERLLVSPFGPVASICSTMLFPFLQALVNGTIMLAFAAIVFGLPLEWSTAAFALPIAVLGTVAFSCFGMALIGLVLVIKQVAAGTTWIVAGISLIAGMYFPVSLLPGWIQWASEVQPFTPTVELMRHALVGTATADAVWLDVLKIVGFVVVLLPGSLWLLKAMVSLSRRRGTILEY